MGDLREYIVTAKSYDVVDQLCEDIESPGGDLYIPNRRVECVNLRPVSRNTHFMLTDEEADLLRNDPRVEAVTKTIKDLGMVVRRNWQQYSEWWWRNGLNDNYANQCKNWGLMRCTNGSNIYKNTGRFWGLPPPDNSSFGLIGTADTGTNAPVGNNVDVVIVDGFMDPSHPEFAVNADGTGGSRVVQYNWFELNPEVTGGAAGVYNYARTDYAYDDNQHGCHVAGTVAGATQGWARGANIYNINPYGSDILNDTNPALLFDYIRVWHNNKPVNPETGYKNPTITNNSWGYAWTISLSLIQKINYRGVLYNGPFTREQAESYGLNFPSSFDDVVTFPARYAPYEADIYDALANGVLCVGAAGNDSTLIDRPGGQDYDNYIYAPAVDPTNPPEYYYNQGGVPCSVGSFITVGSMSASGGEYKSDFSNTGPRIDIWAPGQNIISSVNGPPDPFNPTSGGIIDPGFPGYYLAFLSGTSMASPQVTGVLACVLELNPGWTQQQITQWLIDNGAVDQMLSTNGGVTDYTDLNGAPNRVLTWVNSRGDNTAYPTNTVTARLGPTYQMMAYPRPKIRR